MYIVAKQATFGGKKVQKNCVFDETNSPSLMSSASCSSASVKEADSSHERVHTRGVLKTKKTLMFSQSSRLERLTSSGHVFTVRTVWLTVNFKKFPRRRAVRGR